MPRGGHGVQVILDSSFLIAVVERPTTWFEDITECVGKVQPVLLDCVKQELQRLASGQGRSSRPARVALAMTSGFTHLRCGGASVDAEIVSNALTNGALVATVDSGLLASLRSAHVKTVTLRRGRVSLA